jgi:putative phosphoribosyl transferase
MVLLKGKPYADRRQAARLLGKSLAGYETYHPLILGIPRGGVVVAIRSRRVANRSDIVHARSGLPAIRTGIRAVSESGRSKFSTRSLRKWGGRGLHRWNRPATG